MADLDFTLMGWPNHLLAIEALIKYHLGGGKLYEFMPIQCYFANAREYAPDDIDVRLAVAFYFWKRNDLQQAKLAYEEALSIDPDSAAANYNIGLLYVKLSDFEKAREHARKAYAAGYPLPGLKKMLEERGQLEVPAQ